MSQIEVKNAFVKIEIGVIENMAFLVIKALSWDYFLQRLFIALNGALAGLF